MSFKDTNLRRIARVLIDVITLISMASFIIITLLWIRSYWAFDSVAYPPRVAVFAGQARLAGQWNAKLPTIHELAVVNGRIRFLTARVVNGGLPWREQMTQMRVVLGTGDQGVHPFDRSRFFKTPFQEHEWLGFAARRGVSGVFSGNPCPIQSYEIPIWFTCVLTSTLPIIQIPRLIRRIRQRNRRKRGCCPNCGYDLRATPNQCPECGRAEK